jgi:MSHA biogenesis protein MshL
MEGETAKGEPRKLFTLAVRDVDIRDVLLTLGKRTDLNIIFGPEVKGTVTADLKRVTLEEALSAVLSPLGLEYTRTGTFVRVFPPTLETRIFTLSYLSTTRTGGTTLSATAGGARGGGASAGGAGGGGGGSGAGASSSVSSADNVDFWGDIEKNLGNLISKEGKVVVNKTAGIVAVTDLPRTLQRVARYIELVEGSVQRQVIIEAHIVEVSLNKDFEAGVNWSLITKGQFRLSPFGNALHGNLGGAAAGTGAAGAAATAGALIGQTLASASTAFQIGFVTQALGQTLSLLLQALSTQGQVNVLSSPRIATLNNQKAVIKVATDDVFFTTTRTREPTTGVETTTVTPQTITEGLVLDVTPQIAEDNSVIMNIRPSISERVGQATSPDGSTVPIISVRATDTVVRALDGQTVIIGGLMQQRKTRNQQGIPGMQDVPVVGSLFRRKVEQSNKTELVILLTPNVIIGRRTTDLSPRELELLREAGGASAIRR